MILILDNYDSFTYNLVDLVRRYTQVQVFRNDAISPEAAEALRPAGLLISPGPGRPEDAGISGALLRLWMGRIPVLGVCLGHQLIGSVLGGQVVHASRPVHGKTSQIDHAGQSLFAGLPSPLRVMRYHSLILAPDLPQGLDVTARTADGEIMAIHHPGLQLTGVQFHPESVLTEGGDRMIQNWLNCILS
ncbi:MAG: aminodeoxychorismate/anthranilate synthase component II [Bacteroidia bacterium]|nr:aminodeoxychorismate/anthranilate synthase component II [Bacteroidia bacterium]